MSAPITRAELWLFRHPLAEPLTTVMGPLAHRPALLLRIEDDEGAHGWGEIWCNFPPGGDAHRFNLAAQVLPGALGAMNPAEPEPFAFITARLHRLAIQAGEHGPVAQVAAGADIAIHDLRARRAGQPLVRHLGGTAMRVPAYASGISPGLHHAQVERARARGYRAFKQRIGFGPDHGMAALAETAGALRADEILMADANQAWTLDEALERARGMAEIGLGWLEEPLAADALLDDWMRLAAEAPMPIAGGENLGTATALQEAIASGAYAVLQPDVAKWGGVSGCLAIAREAVGTGLRYCPHSLGGGVALVASAHLLAAAGGSGLLEVDASENPLLEALTPGGLELRDGDFVLPDAPGLGYDPDLTGIGAMLVEHREIGIEA